MSSVHDNPKWSAYSCYTATSLQSFEAMLHKSLLAISFLKATKSRDLSFLKLMCLTVASTFVTLRQHKTEQWSEKKSYLGKVVPLMILSELWVIIRSKICPITCVGDFTCWIWQRFQQICKRNGIRNITNIKMNIEVTRYANWHFRWHQWFQEFTKFRKKSTWSNGVSSRIQWSVHNHKSKL